MQGDQFLNFSSKKQGVLIVLILWLLTHMQTREETFTRAKKTDSEKRLEY